MMTITYRYISILLLFLSVISAQELEKKIKYLKYFKEIKFSSLLIEQERDQKIENIRAGFSVKGEFETTSMYVQRVKDSNRLIKEIEIEYDRKITDARKLYQFRQKEIQAELQVLINSSWEEVRSGIRYLGEYDADLMLFPIELHEPNQVFSVKVPLSYARQFKESIHLLEAIGQRELTIDQNWDYFNWRVYFEGQTFSFGPARDDYNVKSIKIIPPAIEATVAFTEPSGNNKLDADETAEIMVSLKNTGSGPALGFELFIDIKGTDAIEYPKSVYIGELISNASISRTIKLKAQDQLLSGMVECILRFKEFHGFAPPEQKISFSTEKFVPPILQVADIGIDDASGNGKIEAGEVVSISLLIQNVGQGDAFDVSASINLTERDVYLFEGSKSFFPLDNIPSGEYKKVTFKIVSNPDATGLGIILTVLESKGTFGLDRYPLALEFNRNIKQARELKIVGVQGDYNVVIPISGLSIDVEVNIPNTSMTNKNGIAVVIGNRVYTGDVPSVDFAVRDAEYVKEYLIQTLGYRSGNVFYYSNATLSNMKVAFNKLNNAVKKGKSDVFVYYSGHGAPDPDSKQGYFVPVDADPNYIRETGYPVNDLYTMLNKKEARSTTVVIDACFSGSSDQGMILKDISPVFIEVESAILFSNNSVVFTSATGEQVSSWYRDKKHSLFTYYFLKALQGDADENKDKKLSLLEIKDYVDENVPYMARRLNNRVQTPQMMTNDETKVMVNY